MFNVSKSNLLCHDIKRKVFDGSIPNLEIDPYLNMFERVQKFFGKNKSDNEVDALRTAFYLKVGTQVNQEEMKRGSKNQKKATLIEMLKTWGWSPDKVEEINDYKNWPMNKKVALGNRINKILMESYKNISDKNKSLGDSQKSLITEKDTTLLGRKLFSYYNKASHKVENLGGFVDGAMGEKELTILYSPDSVGGKSTWVLLRGITLTHIDQLDPELIIKRAVTLEFALAFTAFNKLYTKGTKILLRADEIAFNDHDIYNAMNRLSSFISTVNIAHIPNEDLLANPRIKQLFIFADFGFPFPAELMMANINECKTKQEYSAFMTKRVDRLKNVTFIYMNSWGELFCKTFSGLKCMMRCLHELAQKIAVQTLEDSNFLKVFTPNGRKENIGFPWINSYVTLVLKSKAKGFSEKAAS